MLKETMTYFDYDGNERTENFYFNLSKAECMELELTTDGGLQNTINRITEAKDKAEIIKLFKSLILKAYGEKSPDGKYFMKSPEISAKFESTEAYSDLFMRLASNADEATRFVNGIVPQVPEEAKKAADLKKNMIPGV
jgi:hypothetical protein